jgi:hypothetical protein
MSAASVEDRLSDGLTALVAGEWETREETYEEGDAYYAPPGHARRLYAGSRIVEFHPTEELGRRSRSSIAPWTRSRRSGQEAAARA